MSQYSVIYCCLPEDILEILAKKFQQELKKGTKVYTYEEELDGIKGEKEIVDETEVYRYTF